MQYSCDFKVPGPARLPVTLLLATLLAACGTTSDLRRADDAAATLDLSSYGRAVVSDFSDQATANKKFRDSEKGVAKKAEYQADVEAAGATFAEYIVAELRKLEVFEEVSRGDTAEAGVLLVGGDITRFERGNAAAKFLVGLGAGSTYFDATVTVKDGASGAELGNIVVDKNSWVLGGAISASQNVEGFMRGGAEKTARELYKAKFGTEPEK